MAFGDRWRARSGGLFGAPGTGVGAARGAQSGGVQGTFGNWYPMGGSPARTVRGGAVPGSIPSATVRGLGWAPTYGDWRWPGFGQELGRLAGTLGEAGQGARELAGALGGAAGAGGGWTTWGEQFGTPEETTGGGGRTTTTGGRWNAAPAGVDQTWWDDFTEQHEGQNPLDYYGEQGEGLAEAMGDLEWSQGFEEMNGRPPNDDEWRWWWFEKRGLNRPRQAAPEEPEEPRPPLWVPPAVAWRQS